MAEHDAAVTAAREHLTAKPDAAHPLSPLPASFGETRAGLHLVAEQLLQEKRRLEVGRGFLNFTPRGFGSTRWENGLVSGQPGQIRIEGVGLISESDGAEERIPLADLHVAAELLGLTPENEALDAKVALDPAAGSALADWFAFGTVVLADLIATGPIDPEPIRLWPEHFDIATVVGGEKAGTRANVGASPGDADHPEPYLYVGPWDQSVSGDLWNAAGFVGAEMGHAELLGAPDQLAAAAGFISARLGALGDG